MARIQNARNLDKLQPPPHCSRSSRSQRTFDGAAPAVHTKNSDRAKFDGVSGHDQKHGHTVRKVWVSLAGGYPYAELFARIYAALQAIPLRC